eukprot:SAG22_NODE_113_length_19407_cov_214.925161_8_plen_186_part_00
MLEAATPMYMYGIESTPYLFRTTAVAPTCARRKQQTSRKMNTVIGNTPPFLHIMLHSLLQTPFGASSASESVSFIVTILVRPQHRAVPTGAGPGGPGFHSARLRTMSGPTTHEASHARDLSPFLRHCGGREKRRTPAALGLIIAERPPVDWPPRIAASGLAVLAAAAAAPRTVIKYSCSTTSFLK